MRPPMAQWTAPGYQMRRLVQLPRERRVAAAFFPERDLAADGRFAEARPPRRLPFRDEEVSLAHPTPDALFLPPWSCLLTVTQARRSASFSGTPCSS
jgi:hypothetical protein